MLTFPRAAMPMTALLMLVSAQPSGANGLDPTFLPETGHFYALVGPFTFDPPIGPGFPAISWGSAKDDAATKTFAGRSGHLATINTEAENNLIKQLLAERPDCFSVELTAGAFRFLLGPWIGAMRMDSSSEFEWEKDEGAFADAAGLPIAGSFVDFVFPPEPNGQNFVNYIDFLARPPDPPALGWSDCNDFDCFNGRSPVCYVVEFDASRHSAPLASPWGLALVCMGLFAAGAGRLRRRSPDRGGSFRASP